MAKIRCSFCKKGTSKIKKMIEGRDGIHICDECIDQCIDIIDGTAFDNVTDVQSLSLTEVNRAIPQLEGTIEHYQSTRRNKLNQLLTRRSELEAAAAPHSPPCG